MTSISFAQFVASMVTESLHPELHDVITKPSGTRKSKQSLIIDKIKDLTSRGLETGLEGNTPRGSSRMYLPHKSTEEITLDGKKVSIKVGTKVSIKTPMERYHDHRQYAGMSLGQLQTEAEIGDHYVNSRYRILVAGDKPGEFRSNHDTDDDGIFPPLIDADHDNCHWSTVGHVDNVSDAGFKKHTILPSHPNGISHDNFFGALNRAYERDHGKYWHRSPEKEAELDHAESHPLVQKFLRHQIETGANPVDYMNIRNLGVFTHPDGSKHIVARDHGYNRDVADAYGAARALQSNIKYRGGIKKYKLAWSAH